MTATQTQAAPKPTIATVPNPVLIPITLGSAMFSLTEAFPGKAKEYNRWYERDHFFANGQQLPFFFTGRRFVATRALKALRYVAADNPVTTDPAKGSFLHVYWVLPSSYDEWIAIGYQNFADLDAQGRMDGSLRETIHTVNPTFLWSVNRDEDGVPPEMALNHPYPGLVVTSVEASDAPGAHDALDGWYRDEHVPAMLAGSPIALAIAMAPHNMREMPGKFGGAMVKDPGRIEGGRFMHFWFLERAPEPALWAELFAEEAARVAATGLGALEFASPFVPTLPGTDKYIDDL
jgi:hypothetical protein